jgi:cyanophycin synthetase
MSEALWLSSLHGNQRLLVEELLSRGFSAKLVDSRLEEIELTLPDGSSELLLDRFTSAVPFAPLRLSADKHAAKRRMASFGIPVPAGVLCDGLSSPSESAMAAGLRFPLAAKPNWGSHGDGFRGPLDDSVALELAADSLVARGDVPFVVEEFSPGREFRVFRSISGGFAVLERIPASAIGDGATSIRGLVERECIVRASARATGGPVLCPLRADAETELVLASDGLGLDDVPEAGRVVRLSFASNLARGGTSRDATDEVCGAWEVFGDLVLSAFPGLPFVGFDVLAESLVRSPEETSFVVLEANSNPGFSMHAFPASGSSRNVASFAADSLFPSFRRSVVRF